MNKEMWNIIIRSYEENSWEEYSIGLPDEIYQQLNSEFQVNFKVGNLEVKVECRPNHTKDTLELSSKLLEYMGLSNNKITNLVIKDNKICIGPVIGIFISNGQVRKANAQNPNFRWIETMKANEIANTIVYYFSIKDVDFACKKILGTYYNYENMQWERTYFPYPDILYDRGGGTLKSQSLISDYIRKELEKNKELIKINPRYFFDKWDVYERLKEYTNVGEWMPLTILYNKPENLESMLEKSSVVYMKDCVGNNGVGVARVVKLSEDKYELSHFFKKLFKYNLNSFDELIKEIENIFQGKKVIVQSAIDLLQIDGGNVDMRATVQKNSEGKMEATAFPVRIGKAECPITSTRSGSSVYTLEDFFKKFFNYSDGQINGLKERLKTFLFSYFKCIENEYGNFGELGIDFAIDKNWRVWFIECNAKPGKDTVYLSYDNETIKKSFLNPLEYGKYLWKNS